jgi:hypothetical protein
MPTTGGSNANNGYSYVRTDRWPRLVGQGKCSPSIALKRSSERGTQATIAPRAIELAADFAKASEAKATQEAYRSDFSIFSVFGAALED